VPARARHACPGSVGWLIASSIALIHACAEEVRAGRIDERDAVRVLTVTVRDLFTGTGQA
jgi:hypothetical protein